MAHGRYNLHEEKKGVGRPFLTANRGGGIWRVPHSLIQSPPPNSSTFPSFWMHTREKGGGGNYPSILLLSTTKPYQPFPRLKKAQRISFLLNYISIPFPSQKWISHNPLLPISGLKGGFAGSFPSSFDVFWCLICVYVSSVGKSREMFCGIRTLLSNSAPSGVISFPRWKGGLCR